MSTMSNITSSLIVYILDFVQSPKSNIASCWHRGWANIPLECGLSLPDGIYHHSDICKFFTRNACVFIIIYMICMRMYVIFMCCMPFVQWFHVSYSNENLIQKYQSVIPDNQLANRVKIQTSSVARTCTEICCNP